MPRLWQALASINNVIFKAQNKLLQCIARYNEVEYDTSKVFVHI